jgi:antitoxin (DNA-binding transcriptional repressor) of toxin-antitoxin stability system
MRTVTKQQAVQSFDKVGDLAHAGETVIVTHGGRPWIKLWETAPSKTGASTLKKLEKFQKFPKTSD